MRSCTTACRPLYPLAMMMIGFAALGDARTTCRGEASAIAAAVVAVVGMRIAGFAASGAARAESLRSDRRLRSAARRDRHIPGFRLQGSP